MACVAGSTIRWARGPFLASLFNKLEILIRRFYVIRSLTLSYFDGLQKFPTRAKLNATFAAIAPEIKKLIDGFLSIT